MGELEKIADELSSGELSLDEAIGRYENAMKLYKFCQKKLEDASKTIEMLTEDKGRLKNIPGEGLEESGLNENNATEANDRG